MENKTAQVVLVKEINPGIDDNGFVDSSDPDSLVEFNDRLFFAADDGENGQELWVSDGTTKGTQLLLDINPGTRDDGLADSSDAYGFTEFNDKLFFSANDGENGQELWVSDGTTKGTQLLLDINPGTRDDGLADSSNASGFTEFNDKLFFTADDGENGQELWVSDGTTKGTQLLLDINPGISDDGFANSSDASGFTEFNDKLFFTANDGENGKELWVSDGTAKGTQLLLDINPTTSGDGFANSSFASGFTEFNDKLFFSADDGENGNELWVSDGTAKGTQLLLDINFTTSAYTAAASSYASNFTEFDDKLFFSANDGENGKEFWVSDGTTKGTQLLVDINPGTNDYDGSINSSSASNFTEFDDKLVFTADDGVNGTELWVSDGTAKGTQLLVDINPGTSDYGSANSSFAANLTVVGDELFLRADNGETGGELFRLTFDDLDTNITGTSLFDNLVGGDSADRIEGLNGRDILDGGDGNDTLLGGNGRDSLIGGAGDDSLIGGKDKDTLIGGVGFDILTGDNGGDTFVIESGRGADTITDFELGQDRLSLGTDLRYQDLTFSGSTINVGDELLVTLTGVDTEQFTPQEFTDI